MFSPYYELAKQLFPCAKIVLDRFHIVQHLSCAISRVRVHIMNQFERKSHEYKAIKRYWKLIQQDSRKLSDKRFYRPTFRMHLTNKEILDKLYSNAKLEATNNIIKLIKRNAFGFRNFENFKKRFFYRSEHQKRKDKFCPFSVLAFLQPTTVDKEPIINYIKKRPKPLFLNYSASRTRTYDIMINSHALLPTELWRIKAKRLPYLTGGNPQLLPAF